MRDMEIRGAGNILGPEQHGHLAAVGYDMYCRLMEETLAEVQGKRETRDLETRVDLRVDAFLGTDYVAEEKQRMEMYKEGLVMKLDERFVPDPAVFLLAIQETDRRLSLTARPPYRLVLKCSAEKDTDLLAEGLKVMRKLTARISELLEKKKEEEKE